MTGAPEEGVIRRVTVALDPGRQGSTALGRALVLAERWQVELVALLIEDDTLLRLAALPFTREVRRDSGALDALEPDRLAATLRRRRDRLQRSLLELARTRNVSVTVQNLRGRWLTAALAVPDTDVLFLDLNGPGGASTLAGAALHRPLATRIRPVWVLYDDTPAARRALSLAAELSRPEAIDLVVLLCAATGPQAWRLQQSVNRLLGEPAEGVHYLPVGESELPGRIDAIRRQGGSLLVLPRSSPLLQEPGTAALLDSAGCPVVLVN